MNIMAIGWDGPTCTSLNIKDAMYQPQKSRYSFHKGRGTAWVRCHTKRVLTNPTSCPEIVKRFVSLLITGHEPRTSNSDTPPLEC